MRFRTRSNGGGHPAAHPQYPCLVQRPQARRFPRTLDINAGRQRRGSAAVELAVVLPILITVLLGATDFGRFSYSAIAVANAARSGAACGSMNPFDSRTQLAWQTAVQQAAIDELSQSSAFDTSKLTVTVTNTTESSGSRRVSVQATYPFKTIVNWSFLPSTLNLQQTVVMRGIR